jgi:hypothetical protein
VKCNAHVRDAIKSCAVNNVSLLKNKLVGKGFLRPNTFLVEHGADVMGQSEMHGEALVFAAIAGCTEEVFILLLSCAARSLGSKHTFDNGLVTSTVEVPPTPTPTNQQVSQEKILGLHEKLESSFKFAAARGHGEFLEACTNDSFLEKTYSQGLDIWVSSAKLYSAIRAQDSILVARARCCP